MEKTQRYVLTSKILTAIIVLVALFSAYMIMNNAAGFSITTNWNMFESILIYPLYLVGLVVSVCTKIPGTKAYRVYYDNFGREVGRKPDNDIINFMFATFIMPLLSHLILLPLMVCAAIYYPLMVVLAALGALFPYLLAISLLFIPYYFFKKSKKQIYKRKRHILIPITAFFSIIVPWVVAEMWCSSSYSYNSDTLTIVALSAMALTILFFMGMILTAEEDEMDVFDDEIPMNRRSKVLIIGGLVAIIGVSAFSFYAYDAMLRIRRDVEDREVVVKHTHIVNTPSLNIRSGPSSKYTVVGKLSNGDLITVLREERGWAIINHNGAEAYVSAKYLKRNE